MADSNLGIRFTDEKYATKKQVQNELRVTMVDKYWHDIVEYRSNFTRKVGVKSIDDSYFSICCSPAISNKLNDVERKINKLFKQYSKISSEGLKEVVYTKSVAECIKSIAQSLRVEISDSEAENIVTGNLSAISPDKIILSKYASLLKDLYNKESLDDLSGVENYLYEIASELVPSDGYNDSIYRTKSIVSQRLYLSNVYDEAPVRLIQPSMKDLFRYLDTSSSPFTIKMIVTMFYINYIKPFDAYNELVSSLLAKYIILNNDLEAVAPLINLESVLLKDRSLNEVFEESQKKCDITYYLNYFCDKINVHLDEALNIIATSKVEEIKNEYYDIKKEEPKREYISQTELVSSIIGKEKEEPVVIQPININEIDETEYEMDKPEEKEVVVETTDNLEGDKLVFTRNAAITNLTFGYSEEDAKKVEQYLIESNPNLSRSQAYFYARHCTIGKFYTIAQYKKEVGCAYETARTSMDKLVSEGYYAKEPYKNKFIYTPIRRK